MVKEKVSFWKKDKNRREALASGHVVPEPSRCVQCGICSFNCPLGLDVRGHAWRGEPITESQCLTCGECIARCPRDVLRFERTNLFIKEISTE
jgi:heterodisulfide reductase subunit C